MRGRIGNSSGGQLPATAVQSAYFAGRDPGLPLGGLDCVAYLEFGGRSIDVGRLGDAVAALTANPYLRLRFADAETLEEAQVVPPRLRRHDLRGLEPGDVAQAVAVTRRRMLTESLDLVGGQTWAVEVSQLPDGTSTMHLAISLAIADIAAIGVLASQLATALGRDVLPEYRELGDVRERLRRARRPRPAVAQEVVDARPVELFAPPQLPRCTAAAGPPDGPDGGAEADLAAHPLVERLTTRFGNADWSRLEGRAQELGCTTAALVLALYERVLRRFSSSAEFLVTVTGVDTTGTEDEVVDRTVTYAHRARPDAMDTFAEAVREVGDELRFRISRGVEATTELREALKAGSGHPGLSPYVFTFAAKRPIFGDDAVAALGEPEFSSTTPQVIIDCRVFRLTSAGVEVAFDVRRDVLPDGMAREIYELFVQSLREVIEHGAPQLELCRSTADERLAVNSTAPARTTGLLYEDFRRRVGEHPHAEAVLWDPRQYRESGDPVGIGESGRLTYAELDDRALRLAAAVHARVAPGAVVAIRLPKGPSQVVAVLGVLYAGCIYLPIGVDVPDARAQAIAEAAGAGLVLTADDLAAGAAGHDPLPEPVAAAGDGLAYIIYTSGSTGAPKGVAIAHSAALNTVADVNVRNAVGRHDRVLAVSALDFDLSVYDIFGPLSCGGAVVTIPEDARRDAFVWGELVRRFGVTVWNTVPGLVEMLLAANDELDSLRTVMCSGDWIDPVLFRRLREAAPKAALVAMGGATEASIWSNAYVIRSQDDIDPEWRSIPYGVPLSGQKYRVVDDEGRDRPNGVAGELWIGGAGVATGYHRAPELTAQRFVTDGRGERWYRTGDLGVWREGPLLFILGRLDTQVKVRGHRVECGEIEHAIRRAGGVSAAVVTPIRNRTALGALVVPDALGTPAASDVSAPVPFDAGVLRERLACDLPHYMVPTVIAEAAELRFTANGKVDRRWAAARLESDGSEASPSPGGVDRDSEVAAGWRRVLGVEQLAPDDNFFVLGGDSLAATRVCAGLRERGIEAGVDQLFAAPTLRAFTAVCTAVRTPSVQGASDAQDPQDAPALRDTASEEVARTFPLTPLQRAYALGADGIRGVVRTAPRYSVVISSAGPVDFGAWSKAIDVVCARLDGLRCIRHGDAAQRVLPPHELPELPPLTWLDAGGPARAADRLRAYLAGLDDETEPSAGVLTAVAVRGHEREIGLSLNYLGLDARSLMGVLNTLISEACGTESVEPIDPSLAEFGRYAARTAAKEAEEAEETEEAEEAEEAGFRADAPDDAAGGLRPPALPVQRIPGERVVIRSRGVHLDSDETSALTRVARDQQVTTSSLLLAEFGQSLAETLGVDAVDISVPMSRRPTDVSSEVLGNFTELALCRCGPEFGAREVHRALGRAVAGYAPGERDVARAGRAAFPVVFTSTLGLSSAQRLFRGEVKAVWSHTRTPGVLIDCQVVPRDEGIELRWDCPDDVLEPGFLERAFSRFVGRIRRLTGSSGRAPAAAPAAPSAAVCAPDRDELVATLRRCAQRVDPQQVRPALASVFDRWRTALADLEAAGEPHAADAEFLAHCLTGEVRVTRLLEHERLAPEALLTRSLEAGGLLTQVCGELRRAAEAAGRSVRVAHLGAGTGLLHSVLAGHLAGTDIEWVPVECSPLLRDLGEERGLKSLAAPPEMPVDVVLALGALHRDTGLAAMLTDMPVAPEAALLLAEVTGPDPASLVTALLDSRIADPATTPLWPVPTWWNWLTERGWRPVSVSAPTPQLALVHARYERYEGGDGDEAAAAAAAPARTAAPVPVLQLRPPSDIPARRKQQKQRKEREETSRTGVEELLAVLWRRCLPEAARTAGPDDDFFALGGDSLAATRVLAELHTRGFTGVRLADLFNIPVLGELARHIARSAREDEPSAPGPAAASPDADADPRTAADTSAFPLTKVQQAYLTGRSEQQLLGGVASHCYFEFDAPELDTERFTAAVEAVVLRHPALRTTVVDEDGVMTGRVGDRPVHPPVEFADDPRESTAAEVPDPVRRGPLTVRIGRSGSPGSPGTRTRTRIGIGMDNLMLDGASMWRVLREIGALYAGATAAELDPLRASFADYVSQRPWLCSTVAPTERDSTYWAANPVPEAPALVSAAQIVALTERPVFDRVGTGLHRREWDAVRAAAADAGLTPAALIFAAYAAELAECSGQERLAVNVTTFDRDLTVPGIDTVVGDFTSLTLVGARVADGGDLVPVGRSAQLQLAAARDHRTVTAIDQQRNAVQETGDPVRGMYPVVFTCGLGMQDPALRSDDFGFGRLVFSCSQTPQTVLDLQVHDDCRGLHITADHVTQLIGSRRAQAVVDGVARRLRDFAGSACARPDAEEPDPGQSGAGRLDALIRQAWERALGTELPRDGANFFRAGGDSLRATRCVRALQEQVHPRITLRTLLSHPDLGTFTAAVANLATDTADDDYEAGEL
ncbi:amino acid adenylation domain-containing protein [Streptomyces yunnanensis]|uniref:Amino acid adenylation domain-containing protein n=1 Tax=Streptomyces yunnanensis TaxID=156453 RepID=A0ABY8AGE9_9ACTN|nr:non-ribosomal peptide synthetase [Streptomyces yunnanensis]WEB44048.1 amino acid adenylation domain-containing protein [Streptomyces yunnanensis]